MVVKFIRWISALVMLSTSLAYGQTSQSSALRFTADGQYIIVPHTDALAISGPLTIEAWVKPEAGILLRGYSSIVSKQLNGTGYMLATNNTANTPVNEHRFKAEVAGIQVTSESQPGLRLWQHVAAVWDGQLKIYVNGQLDGVVNTGSPIPNTLPLWIGSSPFGADTNWRGAIDEVRVWAVARSEAEITSTMGESLCGNETGLRAYWSFDEGEGQTLMDARGGSDGQIYDPEWVPGVELATRSNCPVVVNELVTFVPLGSTFRTTSNTSGCPSGFVGKFSFNARLTDKTTSPDLASLLVKVTTMTNGNLLQNADGGPAGVGATLTVPEAGAYADGVLSPGQFIDVSFSICLRQMKVFTLFVNVLGSPVVP